MKIQANLYIIFLIYGTSVSARPRIAIYLLFKLLVPFWPFVTVVFFPLFILYRKFRIVPVAMHARLTLFKQPILASHLLILGLVKSYILVVLSISIYDACAQHSIQMNLFLLALRERLADEKKEKEKCSEHVQNTHQ